MSLTQLKQLEKDIEKEITNAIAALNDSLTVEQKEKKKDLELGQERVKRLINRLESQLKLTKVMILMKTAS